MIKIDLDTGNAPSVLAALADPGNVQAIVNAMAESYVDDTLDYIKAGSAFTAHTGQQEQSIGWLPEGDGGAVIYANAAYAGYVEYGTDPHVIAPKDGRKGLKIPVTGGGGYIIRRSVNHPGSKPHPFFFADLDGRQRHMQERAMRVLAVRMTQAGA
jgi:hypothetical protein